MSNKRILDGNKMDLLHRAKNGCHESQHALYLIYQHLPKRVVSDFLAKAPNLAHYQDDLYGEAQLVLYKSLLDYEPERGMNMTSYYYQRIRFGLMDYTNGDLHSGIRIPAYQKKNNYTINWASEEELHTYAAPSTETGGDFSSLNNYQRGKILKMARESLTELQLFIFLRFFGFEKYKNKSKSVEEIALLLNMEPKEVTRQIGFINRKFEKHLWRICKYCKRKFHPNNTRAIHCSVICARRYVKRKEFERSARLREKRLSERPRATCQNPDCGKLFVMRRIGRNKYCAAPCYWSHVKPKSRVRPTMVKCQRLGCGEEFVFITGRANKYCSATCISIALQDNKPKAVCQNSACNKQFLMRRGGLQRNKYCSISCGRAVLVARTDEKLASQIRQHGTLRIPF